MTLFSFSFDDEVVHIRDKYMNHECTLVIGIRRAFDHLCEVDYKLYIRFIIFQFKLEAITLTWGVSSRWSFDTNSGWDSINTVKPLKSKNRDKIYLDAPNPNMEKGCDRDFRA